MLRLSSEQEYIADQSLHAVLWSTLEPGSGKADSVYE